MDQMGGRGAEPQAVPGPRSRAGFRADVQGLRAVAVVLVVAYHAVFGDSGGFVGVDVFFVVSGFVITGLLVRELERTGRLSFPAFYARRVRRLLPALALVLLTVAAVAPFVQTPLGSLQRAASTGLATVFVGANAELFIKSGGYFDIAAETNPLLHMWTLAVEEQFYLVFPAVLLLAWRLGGRRRGFPRRMAAIIGTPRRMAAVIVLCVAAASLALCVFLTYSSGIPFGLETLNRRFAFYSSPSRVWEFSVGSLVALAEPWLRLRVSRRLASLISVFAVAALAATVVAVGDSQPFPGFLAILPVAAAGGLLIAGTGPATRVVALLSHRVAVWVGDHSYSWYLWHWPLIVFVRFLDPAGPGWVSALAGLVGLPLAWLTGRVLENPIRHHRRLVGWRVIGLAVACCALPGVAFSGLLVLASDPPAAMRQLAWEGRGHLDATHSCIRDFPRTAKSASCTWTVPGDRGTVLLLGDSNAGQFAEPVLGMARARGMSFTLATYGGCPFAPLSAIYETDPHDTSACDRFVEGWSAEVTRMRPAVVVLASATPNYVENSAVTFEAVDGSGGTWASPRDKAEQWRRSLATMIRGWAAQGVRTVVVNTVPQFGNFRLDQCPVHVAYRTPSHCAVQAPTEQLAKYEARSRVAEEQAVAGVPGATTLNLFDEICGGAMFCSTYQGGHFVYRDGVHLSVSFAERLQPEITAAVGQAMSGGATTSAGAHPTRVSNSPS